MIRSHELVVPVVWLTALDNFLAIYCASWQLIRPVHPVNSGVDVVLIAGADFKDSGDPSFVGRTRLCLRVVDSSFPPLKTRFVGDIDEAFTVVLNPID